MLVEKKISFDCAHFLPGYDGPCASMHGHHFSVSLAIEGPVHHKSGMVVDFSKLKSWLNTHVVDEFDHTLLNDKIENPTAENLALYIQEELDKTKPDMPTGVRLAYIRVWETEDSMVELKL